MTSDSPSITIASLSDSGEISKQDSVHNVPSVVPVLPPVTDLPNEEVEQSAVELNGEAPKAPPPPMAPQPVPVKPISAPPAVLVVQRPKEEPPVNPLKPPRASQVLPTHEKKPVQDSEKVKKRQSFLTRTLWTFIMIGGFIGVYSIIFINAHTDIRIKRSVTSWPCIHDSPGYAVPVISLPRGYCAFLSEICKTRVRGYRIYARERPLEQNSQLVLLCCH